MSDDQWNYKICKLRNKHKKMPNMKLMSCDGEMFEVDVDIAKQSIIIKMMLDSIGTDEGDDEPVPLPNVNAATLKKVIEWCTHHKDDPITEDEEYRGPFSLVELSPWDNDFLKMEKGTLFELLLAANYLDIKGLLDMACKAVANMTRGKTPEEIRQTFNISDDSTPVAENQIPEASKAEGQAPGNEG